jgi:hypothetical protein
MTDSDFTFIQPSENIHNVHSLTPAKKQEERKRRQKPPQEQQEPGEKPLNETPPEQTSDRNEDRHQIDYRA